MTKEIQKVTAAIVLDYEDLKITLTELIRKYNAIEKDKTLKTVMYHQKTYFIMGQISVITSFLNIQWCYKDSGQCYYDYLNELIDKLSLDIQERLESNKKEKRSKSLRLLAQVTFQRADRTGSDKIN